MLEVNYLGILLGTIGAFAVGSLWYSVLFGKLWRDLMGFTPESMKAMNMTPFMAMIGGFASTLVMVFVLAYFSAVWSVADVGGALMLGFLVWLGFQMPIIIHSLWWEGRPAALFGINAAHQLVATSVASLIITLVG